MYASCNVAGWQFHGWAACLDVSRQFRVCCLLMLNGRGGSTMYDLSASYSLPRRPLHEQHTYAEKQRTGVHAVEFHISLLVEVEMSLDLLSV